MELERGSGSSVHEEKRNDAKTSEGLYCGLEQHGLSVDGAGSATEPSTDQRGGLCYGVNGDHQGIERESLRRRDNKCGSERRTPNGLSGGARGTSLLPPDPYRHAGRFSPTRLGG